MQVAAALVAAVTGAFPGRLTRQNARFAPT
jgi:hypothetical protein